MGKNVRGSVRCGGRRRENRRSRAQGIDGDIREAVAVVEAGGEQSAPARRHGNCRRIRIPRVDDPVRLQRRGAQFFERIRPTGRRNHACSVRRNGKVFDVLLIREGAGENLQLRLRDVDPEQLSRRLRVVCEEQRARRAGRGRKIR